MHLTCSMLENSDFSKPIISSDFSIRCCAKCDYFYIVSHYKEVYFIDVSCQEADNCPNRLAFLKKSTFSLITKSAIFTRVAIDWN